MIITYANYGIYDTDTCHSLEAGDSIQKLTYSDENMQEHTVENIRISEICADSFTIENPHAKHGAKTRQTLTIDDIIEMEV